jgi:segregation and condensation protein B
MPNDYSMSPISESGDALDWVKGNLPAGEPETPADAAASGEGAPVSDAPDLARSAPTVDAADGATTPEPAPGLTEPPPHDADAPEPTGAPPETASKLGLAEDRPLPPLPPMEPLSLESLTESLLFVAEGPVPVARLAEALEVAPREIEAALAHLAETYLRRGLSLQYSRDKVQLTTAPAAAERVQRFLGLAAATPLSRAALETLAIIAYQQPVTRPQIESIRGVNSDGVIKNLLSKGIIEEVGRTDGPGRPVLYATTPEFLQFFGITSLADLPPLNMEQTLAQPTSSPAVEIVKG